MPLATSASRAGRPPAASREQVLEVALREFMLGRRIDVQAIAAELGLGRSTIYRWYGSREGLLGAVLVAGMDVLVDEARAAAGGRGGPALLDTFDRLTHALVASANLRRFVEAEQQAALRIITSPSGVVETYLVRRATELIEAEVRAGAYTPRIDPDTLGYAIVRLAEAFLFNDVAGGMAADVGRLRSVQAALLGVDEP
jgi:AcrR family transcriptional regulator